MSDIKIRCQHCSHMVMVSEFADPSSVICHSCGNRLDEFEKVATTTQTGLPKLKVRKKVDLVESEKVVQDTTELDPRRMAKKQPRPQKKMRLIHHIMSWVIFVTLGTAMYFLRYGELLHADILGRAKLFGPILVAAFYVIVVLKAFKDSVFQGVFCILIPPYSLYYIFICSDDFYMRAVLGGLLIGFGEDTGRIFWSTLVKTFDFVKWWIEKGALNLKP